MLQNRGGFVKLSAIADGAEYSFSGSIVTEDYHNLINALRNAVNIEIVSSYGYSYRSDSLDPGPFVMVDYLQQLTENVSEELHGVFYSMYHNADCDSSAGALVAFGEKNGRIYTGDVAFEPVDSIPDGVWYTPLTAMCYDPDDSENLDISAIMSVCQQLCNFSSADDLRCDKSGIAFYLNNLRLETDAQLKSFMALYAKLIDLTDGECCLIGELADIGSTDVKILHFDVEADGTHTMKMAAISE